MTISTYFFISLSFINTLVECEINSLNVRKLDHHLIAKKRQDTLDMCRIFTEENAKMQQYKPKIVDSYKYISRIQNKRNKREVDITISEDAGKPVKRVRRFKRAATVNPVNPALSQNDMEKIENIVEKLYNDIDGDGDGVKFRKNPLLTDATTKEPIKKTASSPSRRLYFGPKMLYGPGPQADKTKRPNNTSVYEKARWRHGIVPYFIDSKTYDAQLQETIMKAFDYIEKATCIRLQKLRERPTDKKSLQEVAWVYISNPAGVRQCVHSNEKRKVDGVQMSVLGYDCMSLGDIVHEVMHILGFSHEHTRSDRDQHISILWDNIKPGYKKYFEISKPEDDAGITLESLPYDYASILHYPSRAFSKNGQLTIQTQPGIKIGQREALSEIDLEKVGAIYSSECLERNKDYLLMTCPSVVKAQVRPTNVSQKEIDNYFKERLWPFGLISYKIRDNMEFSAEEKENIKAVIHHIEKETCIQFRDMAAEENNDADDFDNSLDKQEHEDFNPANAPPIVSLDPLNQKYLNVEHNEFNPENINNEDVAQGEKLQEDIQAADLAPLAPENVQAPPENAPAPVENVPAPPENAPAASEDAPAAPEDEPAASEDAPLGELKRVKRLAKPLKGGKFTRSPQASRRHAANVLVLARSAMPGCKCPKPGKPKGNAVLEINADCFNSVNDLLHLFVHVLGLDHQHNMYDRDSYLHIMWDNLSQDIKEELKQKLPPAASVGFPYDYQSVMHYPWLQIKNGVTNMMYPIWNDGWAMGHWQGLSSFDVQKLNLLYFSQCSERQKQSQQ